MVEQTLALIKPDAMKAGSKPGILQRIQEAGFTVAAEKELTLSKERAEEFYAEHKGKPFFGPLTDFMSSGPITALCLEKDNAIKDWRALMGPTNSHKAREEAPTSLRATFGTDGQQNATHGSDSPESAKREIGFFFGSH